MAEEIKYVAPQITQVDRLIILIQYLSKAGTLVRTQDNAYKIKIDIVGDTASKIPDGNGGYTYASAYGRSYSEEDYSKIIYETKNKSGKISDLISNEIKSKVTEIELTVEGETKLELSSQLMLKLFSFGNIVNIDMGGLGNNTIILPDGKIYLEGFRICGSNIVFPKEFKIESDTFAEFNNINVTVSSSDVPYIEMTGLTVNVDRLNSNVPIKFVTAAKYQESQDDYRKTKIDISNVKFYLNSYEEKSNEDDTGVWKDPLIQVGSNCNTSIFNVHLYGGDYFRLLDIESTVNVSITEVRRFSTSVFGHTIKLRNIRSTNINDLIVEGEKLQTTDTYAIYVDPDSAENGDKIIIHNAITSEVSLITCDGYNGNTLSIIDSNVSNANGIVSTLNSEVLKLSIKKSRFKLRKDLKLEGNHIDLSDSIIEFENSKSIKIEARDSIKIYDSKIFADTGDCEFGLNDNCSLMLNNVELQCKDLTIHQTEESDPTVAAMFVSDSNRTVKFKDSILSCSGSFYVGGGVFSFVGNQTRFVDVNEITFEDLSRLGGSNFALSCEFKAVPINLKNIKSLGDTEFIIYNAMQLWDMNIEKCMGDFIVYFKDIVNEQTDMSVLNANVSNSRVGMSVSTDIIYAKVKVNSTDCLGSCFWGTSKEVMIVPELTSKDKDSFAGTDQFARQYDKVLYGGLKT